MVNKRKVLLVITVVICISVTGMAAYSFGIKGLGYNKIEDEYYNLDNFVPNKNVKGGYEQIVEEQMPIDQSMSINNFIEKKKKSTDKIDQILIEYFNAESREDNSNEFSSVYIPQNDKKLSIITKHGTKILPDLIEKVSNEDYKVCRSILMAAANKITLACPDPSFYITPVTTKRGVDKWRNIFTMLIKTTPNEEDINNENIDSVTTKYGIFVLPQLSEKFMADKNNIKTRSNLSKLISIKENDKIEEYNINECEEWVIKHKDEIKFINNLKDDILKKISQD